MAKKLSIITLELLDAPRKAIAISLKIYIPPKLHKCPQIKQYFQMLSSAKVISMLTSLETTSSFNKKSTPKLDPTTRIRPPII